MAEAAQPQYVALARIALPGGLVEANEKFSSDLVPGRFWKPVNKEAKAAVKARDEAEKVEDVVLIPAGAERVAELESDVERLEKDLAEAKSQINTLQGEIEALTAPPPATEPAAS